MLNLYFNIIILSKQQKQTTKTTTVAIKKRNNILFDGVYKENQLMYNECLIEISKQICLGLTFHLLRHHIH